MIPIEDAMSEIGLKSKLLTSKCPKQMRQKWNKYLKIVFIIFYLLININVFDENIILFE